jgi:hypothetical protein
MDTSVNLTHVIVASHQVTLELINRLVVDFIEFLCQKCSIYLQHDAFRLCNVGARWIQIQNDAIKTHKPDCLANLRTLKSSNEWTVELTPYFRLYTSLRVKHRCMVIVWVIFLLLLWARKHLNSTLQQAVNHLRLFALLKQQCVSWNFLHLEKAVEVCFEVLRRFAESKLFRYLSFQLIIIQTAHITLFCYKPLMNVTWHNKDIDIWVCLCL